MHYVFFIITLTFTMPVMAQQSNNRTDNNIGDQNRAGAVTIDNQAEPDIENSALYKLGKPMGNSPLRPQEMEVGNFNDSMSVRELPIDRAGMTPMEMREFVSLILPRLMSMDHTRISDDLRDIRQYFTDNGWNDYMSTLDRAGVVDSLRQNQMDMTGLVQSTPQIENKGQLDNTAYFWDMSAELMLTYRNLRRSSNFTMTVLPRFIRVPDAKSPQVDRDKSQPEIQRAMKIGILIDSWRLQVE